MKNDFGGIELRIHRTVLVIEFHGALQRIGRRLGAEVILELATTIMFRERARLISGLSAVDCIVLIGDDGGRKTKVTLDPVDHLTEVWDALSRAGVTIVSQPS